MECRKSTGLLLFVLVAAKVQVRRQSRSLFSSNWVSGSGMGEGRGGGIVNSR